MKCYFIVSQVFGNFAFLLINWLLATVISGFSAVGWQVAKWTNVSFLVFFFYLFVVKIFAVDDAV